MPLIVSFTTTQTVGFPNVITITDTTTGTDVTAVSRRIYLSTGYDTTIVPSGTTTTYISWPIGTNTLNIDVLDKDYALNVILQYVDVNGNMVAQDSSIESFTLYNEQFLYDLTQDQTSIYEIIQNWDYYVNKEIMRCEVDSGNQAVLLASDIAGAQSCYDRATNMRLKQNFFF